MRAPVASSHAIVLFDGVCNLCNASVNYIIDHDPAGYFRFASQQSAAGQRLIQQFARDLQPFERSARPRDRADALNTVLLIENGRCYRRSTAPLRIVRRLRGPARLLALAIVIPAPIRDWAYDVIAEHRYQWFGQRHACRVPTPGLAPRWLS